MGIDVSWWERVPDWMWIVGGSIGGVVAILAILFGIAFLSDL